MKTILYTPRSGWQSALRKTVAILALAGFSIGGALAAPLAGTTIGNQAAATYTDASLTPRTATSNTVTTIVSQVAAFTLTASQAQLAAPGAPVNFPHTLTNTGNGTDSFNLTAANTAGTMTLPSPAYYIDANCNGIADNAVPITSITGVLPGTSACFIAVTTVPVTATSTNTASITVNATSGFTPATAASNTDTVTVTAQAVLNVTKSISVSSGIAGTTPVTYTLTYTNTGNTAATQVILADFLPAGASYLAGTATLNGTAIADGAAQTLPVAVAGFDSGLTVAGRLTAVIPTIAAGQSGTLSFNVKMGAAGVTPPGAINNQARYCYNDGAAQQPAACTAANAATTAIAGTGTPTNTATFTIFQSAAVAANELLGNITIGGVSDTVTVTSATQGSTVVFTDYIHNNGNGTDTFNVALTPGVPAFPAGTTFLLFKSDGVTPLTDTNAIPDGVVDTGPVAAGAAYAVVVHAVLPSGLGAIGGAYKAVLTATSTFNPLINDPVTNTLTAVTANSVDLINGAPVGTIATPTATLAQGLGANTGTATPVAVNPGVSVTYPLYVNNTSSVADSYAISSSALPAGWSVAYFADASAGACTTLGATFTNTGVINGVAAGVAANKVVCAVVTTVASGVTAAPGATNITFTATSPTTGASDSKLETVTVNTVRSIALTPPNAGQVFPAGSVVYSHTLVNNGNVTEGAAGSAITMTDPMSGVVTGWNNIVYWDSNNNGTLDPTDLVVLGGTLNAVAGFTGLAPGASIRLFVKVLAAGSAAAGDINTSSLTATTANLTYITTIPPTVVAADTTTVIVGQVLLRKTQALDALCDGIADTAFSNASIVAGAIPGVCVMYQVTATNVGTANVTGVVVSDATPANTTYIAIGASIAATTVGTITAPATLTAGTISATVGTLAPTASAVISFGVKIAP